MLGDWITRLGDDPRAEAARILQQKLARILEGETPYDIFVRWKPLGRQPLGWDPDLDDGVRLNIRPFVEAGVLAHVPNVRYTRRSRQGRVLRALVPPLQRRAPQRPPHDARREARRSRASRRMTTPLEALAEALRDCRKYAPGAEAPPEAILWCDPASEFCAVLPALRARLPNLLTFGAYDPATRTGPALWLRAAAARQVAGIEWPRMSRRSSICPATAARSCAAPRIARRSCAAGVVCGRRHFLRPAEAGARLDVARLSRGAGQPGRPRHSRGQSDARGARPCRRPPVRRADRRR